LAVACASALLEALVGFARRSTIVTRGFRVHDAGQRTVTAAAVAAASFLAALHHLRWLH
jgi:hypothetical protein